MKTIKTILAEVVFDRAETFSIWLYSVFSPSMKSQHGVIEIFFFFSLSQNKELFTRTYLDCDFALKSGE